MRSPVAYLSVAASDRSASRSARPALLSRLARPAGRIAAWTLVWTLFQWWAVIGWTDGGGLYATGVFIGALAVVVRGVERRLWRASAARARAGVVIPLAQPTPRVGEERKAA